MTSRALLRAGVLLFVLTALAVTPHAQVSSAPPILVVVNDSGGNPFGTYLAEILRAEGLTAIATAPLATVTATDLGKYRLVVLGETPLTATQAALFSNYVSGGGRFVAMRPDAQLAPVLGLGVAAGSTDDGYVGIDGAGVGAGLPAATLPYKGPAMHFDLAAGAVPVAALYASRDIATGRAAVVRYNRTAAWSFDLARSTVYTRQGDPSLAGQERDGEPPYRTVDLFAGRIDLERMPMPHADIQQRLFVRVLASLLADSLPLPRLWYFPGTARTMLVPTADAHTTTGSAYQQFIDGVQAAGGRATLYLPPFVPPPDAVPPAMLAAWRAAGHEISLHPVIDGVTVAQAYDTNRSWFSQTLLLPPGPTVRQHSLAWAGWIDPVLVMRDAGVRMDTSYYPWGPAVFNPTRTRQAHGYITGSGLPMRFVTASGAVLPVYQQATSLADEQLVVGDQSEELTAAQALDVSRRLIDDSEAGGHSAIVANFHVDHYPWEEVRPWVDGTLEYARALQVPTWTAERWLRFTEARAATTVTGLAWTAASTELALTVAVPAGAEPQTLLLARGVRRPPDEPAAGRRRHRPDRAADDRRRVVDRRADRPVAGRRPPGPGPLRRPGQRAAGEHRRRDGRRGECRRDRCDAAGVAQRALRHAGHGRVLDRRRHRRAVRGLRTGERDGHVRARCHDPVHRRAGARRPRRRARRDGRRVVAQPERRTAGRHAGGASRSSMTTRRRSRRPTASPPASKPRCASPRQACSPTTRRSAWRDWPRSSRRSPRSGRSTSMPTAGSPTRQRRSSPAPTSSPIAPPPSRASGRRRRSTSRSPSRPTVQRPRDLRVFSLDGQRLTLRWSPPRAGPAPEGYVVEGGVAPGETLAAIPTGPVPLLTVDAPIGAFRVRVRAIGGGVTSAASVEVPVYIGVPVAPSAPASLLSEVNGTSVALSWRNTFGGGAPEALQLEVSGSAAASVPLPLTDKIIFDGVPGGTYTVAVRARNLAGSSAPSAPVVLVVPGTCTAPPRPPDNVLAYVTGRHRAPDLGCPVDRSGGDGLPAGRGRHRARSRSTRGA